MKVQKPPGAKPPAMLQIESEAEMSPTEQGTGRKSDAHGDRPDEPKRSGPKPAGEQELDGADTEDLAGPHASPGLTNPNATPGAGVLPADTAGDDVDPGAG